MGRIPGLSVYTVLEYADNIKIPGSPTACGFIDKPSVFVKISGGSKGGAGEMRPPWGSKFFQFHAVFGKIRQIRILAPPPRGNPGSATED